MIFKKSSHVVAVTWSPPLFLSVRVTGKALRVVHLALFASECTNQFSASVLSGLIFSLRGMFFQMCIWLGLCIKVRLGPHSDVYLFWLIFICLSRVYEIRDFCLSCSVPRILPGPKSLGHRFPVSVFGCLYLWLFPAYVNIFWMNKWLRKSRSVLGTRIIYAANLRHYLWELNHNASRIWKTNISRWS